MSEYLTKLRYALPWLARYPFVRANSMLQANPEGKKNIIFIIANHFEPSWKQVGMHDLETQRRRAYDWHEMARKIGEAVKDADGTKFRHTNFYPAEQYDREILKQMAAMQKEGLGEVEIHLHHGVEEPDTAENLRKSLTDFRDCLAEEHKCLSRFDGEGMPMYAFVHGNLALANSCGGKFCGVDEEMQILQETGCYVDMTMPSAPDRTQVSMLNQIYECGGPLTEKAPHRKGRAVRAFGSQPQLPLIFTGPLVFNWTRRVKGLPVPRLDDGGLVDNQPMDLARLNRWIGANVIVKNRPEWVFVKLFCHGFFDYDQSANIGEKARNFFSEIIENGERTNEYTVHFASAREAFNMVSAAIDGKPGAPGEYRDYRLKMIMN
ncbi:MAG: hypothetical protein H7070_11715 [Saprospiraceae bacterium]|nr:hypothetical protein [Pyrinomonadaceae bacterium]